MKIIALLGGTGWSSTISFYTKLNEMVNQKLGGHHRARIYLSSIDYHLIMENYGHNHQLIASILKEELNRLLSLKPDCFMICCNSLHKYYDMIQEELEVQIPIFHAADLTANFLVARGHNKVLFLATKFTMEDGFFIKKLESKGIKVVIPNEEDRNHIRDIHAKELMRNKVSTEGKAFFKQLVAKVGDINAVVSACTEFSLALDATSTHLPIIDPMHLQCLKAVEFALPEKE